MYFTLGSTQAYNKSAMKIPAKVMMPVKVKRAINMG